MKKILLIVLILSSFLKLYSQEKYHIVLLEKNNKEKIFTHNSKHIIEDVEDEKLKKVFTEHKVKNFHKCVMNSKKKSLDGLYEMHIEGDLQEFKLQIKSTGDFNFIRELPIATINVCSNPAPPVNDTYVKNNWINNNALELIDANCAWSITTGNPNIIVGIADTEFKNHPDLQANIAQVTGPITIEFPHGLWVAGCCSPVTNNNLGIAGLGYHTRIAGYRVAHSKDGSGLVTGNPYSAILQAYNDGRPIINVSWSATGLTVGEATNIVNNGTVLVLAAGNDSTDTDHSTIANIPGVILVSSVDKNNEHRPTHHARNQWIDLCAPGDNVSTLADPDSSDGSNIYRGAWGTSNAAPYVSATVALMLDVNKCLSPGDVELVLEGNCDPIADGALFPGLLGAGRLNAYQAVLGAIEEGTSFVNNQTLWGTQTRQGLYVSSTNTTIPNGANVTFSAEEDITLDLDFEIQLGAEFTTEQNSITCN